MIAKADANGQLHTSYGYALGSTFSTNPLWTKLTTAGTTTYYTYQNDHLGTPQKLLNQSGLTVWSATYDAFGKATVDPASTITNNLRFPGQYADQETGLHYNWNRYYDPTVGRYVTSDPIGLNGGINIYTYVEGNSEMRIDPKGLAHCVLVFNKGVGRLHCEPENPINQPVDIPVASGNNGKGSHCKNNPDCDAQRNRGPIPAGDWIWTDGNSSKPNGRVLEPLPGTNTHKRSAIRSHSCLNAFGPLKEWAILL